MKSVIYRGVASFFAVLLYGWVNFLVNPVATVLSGQAAGKQLENSNTSYVESTYLTGFFGHLGVPAIVLFAILAFIWWRELKVGLSKVLPPVVMILFVLLSGKSADAYYDKTDYSEAVMILPNESAFFIPDVGANKDTQVKFGSTEYLEANKVAAKRFVIPHAKFSGSSLWSDFYVPTGRLIVVDRTPYMREWTASNERGTAAINQSFPCQSSEGLNITVEVGIATSVSEENAARFLYWFGTNAPQGDRRDPQVVFTSVYYGRSLAQVMDSVGRGKVQSIVCREIGARTFDKANTELNAIMDVAQKGATDFLASRGITLDYIGWAGTFSFDTDVQKAVNDKYVATSLSSSLPTLQALADIRVKEGLGDGLRAKGLPASLVAIPSGLLGSLGAMFGGKPADAK